MPHVLAYEGRITVSGTNFQGSGHFKFALVNAAGSATYWSNDGTSTAGNPPTAGVDIPVNGGLYNVLLGNGMQSLPPSVFADHDDVHLRVWFNDGVNGYHQLSPDQRIAAVGYAMAVPSGSITATQIANGSITTDKLADSSITSGKLANGSVTADKLATLIPQGEDNALTLKTTTLGPDAVSGSMLYQGKELASLLMMRSSAPDLNGNGGNFTLWESQTKNINGHNLTCLELQNGDLDGSGFFALSAEGNYGTDGGTDVELCNPWGAVSALLYSNRNSNNEKLLANFRLYPTQRGNIPEDSLLRFSMAPSLWGNKSALDVMLDDRDGCAPFFPDGYFQVFPITGPGGMDTVLRLGLDKSFWGNKMALDVSGPAFF